MKSRRRPSRKVDVIRLFVLMEDYAVISGSQRVKALAARFGLRAGARTDSFEKLLKQVVKAPPMSRK
jgi:hypothetical protein